MIKAEINKNGIDVNMSGSTHEMYKELLMLTSSILIKMELARPDDTPVSDYEALIEFGQKLIIIAEKVKKECSE